MTTLLNLDPSQVPDDGNGIFYDAGSKKWLPGPLTSGGSSSTSAQAVIPLTIPTYDGNSSVGHPDVVHVPGGWNGYEYWMAFTPFPTSPRENPSVVASNDGINWEVPDGLTNPIAPYSLALSMGYDYWADTDMVLSPDGTTMVMLFKGTKTGVSNHYLRTTSTDGITWTAPAVVITNAGVSPCLVLEDDDTLTMFDRGDHNRKWTSGDLGVTWSGPTNSTSEPTLPTGFGVWHLDVTRVGGTLHALVNVSAAALEPGGPLRFRLCHWQSADGGATWTGTEDFAVPLTGSRFDQNGHYRSAILPAASGRAGLFDLWVNGINENLNGYDSASWNIIYLRDYDLSSDSWSFAAASGQRLVRETDERWVMAADLMPGAATVPFGVVSGWPVRGIRHQTAVDVLAASWPPLPADWTHFTIEALVVTDSAVMGNVMLNTRYKFASSGDVISAGTFRAPQVTTLAQNQPQWVDLLQQTPTTYNAAVVHGKPLKIQVDRSFGNAGDTLDATLHFIAVRVRRVRRAAA